MTLARRQFLSLAGGGATAITPARAWSQTYPARPVHMIVPLAAGGPRRILSASNYAGRREGRRAPCGDWRTT
jgi:hypothetical protein